MKYKTLFSTMKAFVAAVAMAAAAAQAAPEADPQLLLAGANPMVYGTAAAAHTQTMVHHPNGAVVPDDTPSVKAAKVDHLNAKAIAAYLNKPIVPVVQTLAAAAKPIIQTVASPVVDSYSGLYTPYKYLGSNKTYANKRKVTSVRLRIPDRSWCGGWCVQVRIIGRNGIEDCRSEIVPDCDKGFSGGRNLYATFPDSCTPLDVGQRSVDFQLHTSVGGSGSAWCTDLVEINTSDGATYTSTDFDHYWVEVGDWQREHTARLG